MQMGHRKIRRCQKEVSAKAPVRDGHRAAWTALDAVQDGAERRSSGPFGRVVAVAVDWLLQTEVRC